MDMTNRDGGMIWQSTTLMRVARQVFQIPEVDDHCKAHRDWPSS